ncbi:C-_U-editing enzyme APOBEC-1-like [Tiliqua scincoides]|uniref:C->U-editing enzyme APOBEC-1-like n=1 Tax=Tiliqua scincoides TaxID=71010 RepID=UPI0034617D42
MAQREQFDRRTSQRWRIEPEAFMSNFAEDSHPKETDLLYEIRWGRSPRTWKNFCRNDHPIHAEVNFLKNKLRMHSTTPCYITWFLSWSPCGVCSRRIIEFLAKHHNVRLKICVARLYRSYDKRNQEGLRNLDQSQVNISIMSRDDFFYCWRKFVNQQSGYCWRWHFLEHVYSEELYWIYSEELDQILESY